MTQKANIKIFYADEMLKNSEEGARHLSSNKYIHHYDEGPAEKLDSLLGEYMAKDATEAGIWQTRIAKANSKAGQIFHHQETVDYLKDLHEFRPHFNVDEFFSINFCVKNMHNVNGAVRTFTFKSK